VNADEINIPFDIEILSSIMQSCMGGYWIITNVEKSVKKENILYHKQWEDNNSGVTEVLILLELLPMIESKGRNIEFGEISIGFDYRKGYKKIVNQIKKSNVYAQEAGVEIS